MEDYTKRNLDRRNKQKKKQEEGSRRLMDLKYANKPKGPNPVNA